MVDRNVVFFPRSESKDCTVMRGLIQICFGEKLMPG